MTRAIVILVLTTFPAWNCSGQSLKLTDFKQVELPVSGSLEWKALRQSGNHYQVQVTNGHLTISHFHADEEDEVFKLPSGNLVGTDMGEWGGSLTYVPNDTTQDEQLIIEWDNVLGTFRLKNELYFITKIGMSGELCKIESDAPPFSYKTVAEFTSRPVTYATLDDTLVTVCVANLSVIQGKTQRVLFEGMFWRYLSVTSIAALNFDEVYIGMRGGIAKLNLNLETIEFYQELN